jgi:hypothetical protein
MSDDLRIVLDDEGIRQLQQDWLIRTLRDIHTVVDQMLDEAKVTDVNERIQMHQKATDKARPLLLKIAADDAAAFRAGDPPESVPVQH